MECPVCGVMIAPAPTAAGPFAGGTCSRECARAKRITDTVDSLMAELPALTMTIENLRLTLVEVR